jgi:hypothetical protein
MRLTRGKIMNFDEMCKIYKDKPSMDFYKQKKTVEICDQPERLNPEDAKSVYDSPTTEYK